MQPIDRKEPKISKISPLESINRRKQDAPNIAPLGEVSAEKIERLFGQKTPKKSIKLDPAPSRVGYKIQRLWLTPIVRNGVTIGFPLMIIFLIGLYFLTNDNLRAKVSGVMLEAQSNIQARPEFKVELMKIDGGTEELAKSIRKSLNLQFPTNSFDLDLPKIKNQIEQMNEVKVASLYLRPGGLLEVQLDQRKPLIIWRDGPKLEMVDSEGELAGLLTSRLDRLDLPLIAGTAAKAHMFEALELYAMAEPIAHRLRGLRRMGMRRWDAILDRGLIIQLPEDNPLDALNRVLALDTAQQILTRDIVIIDMRDAARPVLRLTDHATKIIRASAVNE